MTNVRMSFRIKQNKLESYAMKRTVYLDYAATTPTDPRVVEAMMPYFTDIFGNSSSNHRFGRKAEQAIEDARDSIARHLNCKRTEIVFTSCGSEGNNLAIRGVAWAQRNHGRGNHLVTTPIEHSAVGKTVDQLASKMGFEQTLLPVDHYGMVDVEDFANTLRETTTLASVIYANNEVGTIQPIPQLAQMAHEHGVLFHTDAVQAVGQLTLDVQVLGVDLMSISGHKFYAPKGVGALYVREGVELIPSQSGGSHENGRRAGTLNTAFIVAMAKALDLAYTEQAERNAHYCQLRDALIEGVLRCVSDVELSGHPQQRLPSHASFVIGGIDGNQLLMHLDIKGVGASSASACKTGNPEPSGVLLAMGYGHERALGSLRLSVGHQTTLDDVEYALGVIAESVESLRKLKKALAQ
jgi:cysteine desulfurase